MWPISFLDFRIPWKIPVKVACFFLYGAAVEYISYRIVQNLLKPPEIIERNNVIFFTDKCNSCWSHICERNPCGKECAYSNMKKLVNLIEEAKESIDTCIYTITNYDLAFALVDALKRGVRVRIVSDNNRIQGTGSQIQFLKGEGIPVRIKNSTYEMHHKYFIVDSALLVNGSFNWTMQAFTGNWENAIVCEEENIVSKFTEHFNDLWQEFVPLEKS